MLLHKGVSFLFMKLDYFVDALRLTALSLIFSTEQCYFNFPPIWSLSISPASNSRKVFMSDKPSSSLSSMFD